jgi:hypothetical protein
MARPGNAPRQGKARLLGMPRESKAHRQGKARH